MEYFFMFIFICAGISALFGNNHENYVENQGSGTETAINPTQNNNESQPKEQNKLARNLGASTFAVVNVIDLNRKHSEDSFQDACNKYLHNDINHNVSYHALDDFDDFDDFDD